MALYTTGAPSTYPDKRIPAILTAQIEGGTFGIAQHDDLPSLEAVEAKLAQFPKGTVFVWEGFNEGQAEDLKKSTFEALKAFLVGLGMTLETPPPIRRS